jgi:outer membrane protein
MNKKITTLAIAIAAFSLGLAVNNFASAGESTSFSVAVVDVQKVVAGSAQVNSLKQEEKQKKNDLISFIKNARTEVSKETDKDKKNALEEKYNKQLNEMKKSIETDYAKKLHDIDTDITKVIQTKAKTNNYNVVLSKSIVLYGGTDITDEVSKEVK